MIQTIIFSACSFIVGALCAYLIAAASSKRTLEALSSTFQTEKDALIASAETEKKQILENSAKEIEVKTEAWQTILANAEANHEATLSLMQNKFDESIGRMQEEIKNLTSKMLRERQEEFRRESSSDISEILTPLNITIAEMKKAMDTNSKRQDEFSGLFSANVSNLLRQSEAARLSADRLANALGRNSKVQGQWGETILSELLESQGLTEGIHFDTQAVFTSDSSLRPDVILHLDNERDVIIDAKVSLSDYISYLNAENDNEREMALRKHISSIENHVKELVRKDYSSHLAPPRSSIGYVIMFVPNTAALHLAVNAKPDLWRKAMENNVYIADEQTLYAALKIVRLTWSRIAQNENHREVYALANEMLDRVGKFMEKYVEIGTRLEAASKAYSQGFDKLKEGGHSIPGTCRKLIRMGAKMEKRKNVPDTLLGRDNLDAENLLID